MIRNATHSDIPGMIRLGCAMHAESRYAGHAWRDAKVRDLIGTLIDSDDGLALVVEGEDGELIGGFLGSAFDHWCTGARQSSDFALFVRPESRGGLIGLRLLRRYATWARSRGVADDLIGLGITTGVDLAASTRMFEIAGFHNVGNLFVLGEQ